MEKTYLITGATSDVGYELIRSLNDGSRSLADYSPLDCKSQT